MRTLYCLIPIVALTAGCSTLTPTEDPVQLRLTDLEARLVRIEKVIDNDSLLQLANEVSDLQSEVQSLRGDVDTLRHDTEAAAQRQRDLYLDVDQRLQTIEQSQARTGAAQQPGFGTAQSRPGQSALPGQPGQSAPPAQSPSSGQFNAPGGAAAPGGGTATTDAGEQPPQPTGTDQDNYNAAFALIQARRYEDAADAFSRFLTAFPQSPLADNAQYWLAETYYVRSEFETALGEFEKVISNYPQSAKLPDALLKVGYCNYELKRWDAARTALQRVMRDYPDTTAARLASQRLDKIAQEAG